MFRKNVNPSMACLLCLVFFFPGCRNGEAPSPPSGNASFLQDGSPQEKKKDLAESASAKARGSPAWEERKRDREYMVSRHIKARGVSDPAVLKAMRTVPRHFFVPKDSVYAAYADHAMDIGKGQTISQPFIVASMTELLKLEPHHKVLEIGTGSGYQAAILAEIAKEVYTIEIIESLGKRARKLLEEMGYENIRFRIGDGYAGWPEAAPFDAVIVTAAPPYVPKPLLDQLKEGGRLVIPVGRYSQELKRYTKTKSGIKSETVFGVRFVPMTGKAQKIK